MSPGPPGGRRTCEAAFGGLPGRCGALLHGGRFAPGLAPAEPRLVPRIAGGRSTAFGGESVSVVPGRGLPPLGPGAAGLGGVAAGEVGAGHRRPRLPACLRDPWSGRGGRCGLRPRTAAGPSGRGRPLSSLLSGRASDPGRDTGGFPAVLCARDRMGDPRYPPAGRKFGCGSGRTPPDLEGIVALSSPWRKEDIRQKVRFSSVSAEMNPEGFAAFVAHSKKICPRLFKSLLLRL